MGYDAGMTRYLIARGILSGSAADRAIAAGLAVPLAGGPLAFTLAEGVERAAGEGGDRQSLDLGAARAFA
ncbi:MAG: hypothetical protein JNK34_13765, partial [Tabrizicola sp.]|nr:hypothetical protein [Tabrizicola sp.]